MLLPPKVGGGRPISKEWNQTHEIFKELFFVPSNKFPQKKTASNSCRAVAKTIKRKLLEVNHHIKNGGSFWIMINPYYKKWWFINLPIKNGGWTFRETLLAQFAVVSFKLWSVSCRMAIGYHVLLKNFSSDFLRTAL